VPGSTVLTTAATSALGIATIQIARDLGATVIATTRKREKIAKLLKIGAHHAIATEEEPLVHRVMELTGGQGVDLALDAIAGDIVADILTATKIGGLVRLYGVQSLPNIEFASARLNISLSLLVMKTITYSALFELITKPDALAEGETYIRDAVKRGALTPTVERVFRLDDIVEAHRCLDAADLFGKIVVVP
jgi:NADPH:quinone reductase-like Zn-dependent oxidoreductase